MKKEIIQVFKTLTTDRKYLWAIIGVFLVTLMVTIYGLVAVRFSDIQVVTRYTAFGDVHFYKDAWWSLYGFALTSLLIGLSHIFIMVKLFSAQRRSIGLLIGWLAVALLIVAALYFKEILKLAYI